MFIAHFATLINLKSVLYDYGYIFCPLPALIDVINVDAYPLK